MTQGQLAPLSQVDPADPARFGGKACGLARLMRAGARVPDGFALPVSARPPDRWSVEERRAFEAAAAALLARGPIAVRSSAAAEDGVIASYAGLFESVLDVATPAAALEAVATCIASGAGERVRAYAHSGALPVGVVCQTMVPARAAGVCFTVDPIGRDGAVVIEVVEGLGDALVSGRATPDRWRVYRTGFGRYEAHGESRAAPFTREQAMEVATGADRLAQAFGCPLDLEWAIDATGQLYWVQARPVTVAAPPPSLHADVALAGANDGPVRVWANYNVCETMPEPLPELTWSIWRDYIPPAVARLAFDVPPDHPVVEAFKLFDRVNGRVYWNLNAFFASPLVGRRIVKAMDWVDPRSGRVTQGLLDQRVLHGRRARVAPERIALSIAARMVLNPRHFTAGFQPLRVRRVLEEFGERERARRAQPLAPLSDAAVLAEIDRLRSTEMLALRDFPQIFAVGLATGALTAFLFRHALDAVNAIGSGLSMTPTATMSLELDRLVQQARPLAARFENPDAAQVLAGLETDEAGRAWLSEYRGFLYRNSQRCPREFDIAVPRWDEEPAMLVGIVRASLKVPSEPLAERMARIHADRRATIERAIRSALPPLRPLMRLLARQVDHYLPLRELPKHVLMITFQRVRHAALELGVRLVARGVIDRRDDVFHLELDEVRRHLAGGDARELVARRRAQQSAWAAMEHPGFVRSDGVPVLDEALQVEGALCSGVPVSVGVASGPVRVLDHPDAEAFQQGDVLVVELADPGWTPLFARASAIVMEVGGVMCHAAVVARELGIPAVVGVRDARKRLSNGQRVTVDGGRGVVLP